MKKKSHNIMHNDKGNALLVTTIIILILTVIVGATINISGIQFDLSMFQRNTSNTYYLATSALEKQTEMINKAIQTELANNIEKVSKEFFKDIIPTSDAEILYIASSDSHEMYDKIEYVISPTTGPVLKIRDTGAGELNEYLKEYLFDFINDNFLRENGDPALHKQLAYNVVSDRQADTISTEVTILSEVIYNEALGGGVDYGNPKKDQFKMTATAISKNGADIFDKQVVESVITIDIPDKVEHQIRDKYKWVGNPPEILDSAITCFSDMVVTGELTVKGDIRVKGIKSTDSNSDADQSGGLIVSNGGQLIVEPVASSAHSGNIYCINNVATTNGWGSGLYDSASSISVEGDIIASTVGIYDDYYIGGTNQSPLGDSALLGNKVRNNTITVKKNIFADNDVKIDKWVGNSSINVDGTIFAISDNNYGGAPVNLDPNLSSGVFNQGFSTTVSGYQMFVHGQPFVMFSPTSTPLKLWESIGEPFDGLNLYGNYFLDDSDDEGDPSYLHPLSTVFDRIRNDAIQLGSYDSYATAGISANIAGSPETGIGLQGVLLNQSNALAFFSQGGYNTNMGLFTGKDNGYMGDKGYIIENSSTYYEGAKSGNWKNKSMYKKDYEEIGSFYKGIRRYMTAMRSIFYGKFSGEAPTELLCDEVVDFSLLELTSLSDQADEWSYNHPIYNVGPSGKTIDIKEFYVYDDPSNPLVKRPYPSIIINTSDYPLTIKTTGEKHFKGIIISKGNVILEGDIIIEGAIIVGGVDEESTGSSREDIMTGGTAGLLVSSPNVQIIQNADMFLEVECGNYNDIRLIMNALKITKYADGVDMNAILGPYSSPKINYTLGHVVFTDKTRLDFITDKLKVSIKNMKKIY